MFRNHQIDMLEQISAVEETKPGKEVRSPRRHGSVRIYVGSSVKGAVIWTEHRWDGSVNLVENRRKNILSRGEQELSLSYWHPCGAPGSWPGWAGRWVLGSEAWGDSGWIREGLEQAEGLGLSLCLMWSRVTWSDFHFKRLTLTFM